MYQRALIFSLITEAEGFHLLCFLGYPFHFVQRYGKYLKKQNICEKILNISFTLTYRIDA